MKLVNGSLDSQLRTGREWRLKIAPGFTDRWLTAISRRLAMDFGACSADCQLFSPVSRVLTGQRLFLALCVNQRVKVSGAAGKWSAG